jgi:predicted nucleic acid-binding protein
MSVFVDTGVFYAHHDEDSNRHDAATDAMETVLDGDYGTPMTSDYVFDETVTLAVSRFADPDRALVVGDRILGRGQFPAVIDLLFVGHKGFQSAVETIQRYDDHGLSFTDATTIALLERHDVERVLSFDDDFDGLVDRLDPMAL